MNTSLLNAKKISLPLSRENAISLRAGEIVLASGTVYTARDAAHKRIVQALDAGNQPPLQLDGCAIYYCGPSPAKQGEVIGSCGPTSSARMDAYSPRLIEQGITAMVGKGKRSQAVIDAMRGKAVYLLAVGGAAAYYKQFVVSATPVAYPDLGCEAIVRLEVKDLPLIVGIDSHGKSVFEG